MKKRGNPYVKEQEKEVIIFEGTLHRKLLQVIALIHEIKKDW